MKKAFTALAFFVLFCALVFYFVLPDPKYVSEILHEVGYLGIFTYCGLFFSAVLTRLFTRREHSEFENRERFFNRFLGKWLLTHFIFTILLFLAPILIFGYKNKESFMYGTELIGDFAIPGLIAIIFASYILSHLLYVWHYHFTEDGSSTGAFFKRILFGILALIFIRFGITHILTFANNAVFASHIPYKDGEVVELEGYVSCITQGKRGSDDSRRYSHSGPSCKVDALFDMRIVTGDLEREDEDFFAYTLSYEGKHWTTREDFKGIKVTGVFNKKPDSYRKIAGIIELTSVVNVDGVELLPQSEIQHKSLARGPVFDPVTQSFIFHDSVYGNRNHGESYEFDEYYYVEYELKSESSASSQNYNPVEAPTSIPQNIEPSVITTRNADGSGNIVIMDPSDKWTPAEEEQMRREATMDFYKAKTPSIPNTSVNTSTETSTAVSAVPTTQEILQIFIDNPDFSFSEEEQKKRSAYITANPMASGFGYYSPQKTVPDPTVKKIMYWPGKINQHWDIASQKWISDPDGISGADIRESTYCAKWFGEGSGVSGHANETISTWREAGKTELFTATRVSMECL